MQYPFSCTPQVYTQIEGTLSKPRLGRYLPAAKGDKHLSLRLYIWNIRICEAFYLPCQLAEVALRNGILRVLNQKYGCDWHTIDRFTCNLPNRHKSLLSKAIDDSRKDHGKYATPNHIVALLPLGFWVHLLTRNFEHLLWRNGLSEAFPNLPTAYSRNDLYDKVEQFRSFRNRTAHHFAIFDKGPIKHYQNILEIISWTCADTAWLSRELSRVPSVINQRPQI